MSNIPDTNLEMSIQQLADHLGIKPYGLTVTMKRNNLGVVGTKDIIQGEILTKVLQHYKKNGKEISLPHAASDNKEITPTTETKITPSKSVLQKKIEQLQRENRKLKSKNTKVEWGKTIVKHLPIPMLGLGLMYGVFQFTALVVGDFMAYVHGAAFEFIYIGLPFLVEQNKNGWVKFFYHFVTFGAVATSIGWNVLAIADHMTKDYIITNFEPLEIGFIYALPVGIILFFLMRLFVLVQK